MSFIPFARSRHRCESSARRPSPLATSSALRTKRLRGVSIVSSSKRQAMRLRVRHQHRLPLGRLDRHEAHGRARHRLADRLGIGGVDLAAPDVGLRAGRRDQPHCVAQRAQLARPVLRRAAGLDADQAGRQGAKHPQDLTSPRLAAQHHLPGGVHSVRLKRAPGDVQADRGPFHRGRRLCAPPSTAASLAHRCRSGAAHRIKAELPVPLPCPREWTVKTTPEFGALKARLMAEIRDELRRAIMA